MKNAKLIYFPVVAVLVVIFSIFSFIHVFDAGSKNDVSSDFVSSVSHTATALTAERDKNTALGTDASLDIRASIDSRLAAMTYPDGKGMAVAGTKSLNIYADNKETDQTYTITFFTNTLNKSVANYFVQSEKVSAETIAAMDESDSDTLYAHAGKQVNNIVVYIPGTDTVSGYNAGENADEAGDAILFAAHMDSVKIQPSSQDTAATVTVASMLEQINDIVSNNKTFKNDIIFLFTDSRHDNSLGINVFMNQFYGFRENANDFITGGINDIRKENDLTSRIKFAINFDSLGTGDATMLIQTSDNNSKVVAQYAKAFGGSYSNAFVSDVLCGYKSDFSAVSDINSLNLVTFGKLFNNDNSNDSIAGLSTNQIKALAAKNGSMMANALKHFGDYNLSDLDSSSNAAYYSVLGMFTIAAPQYVAYILGALVLAMLIAAVVLSIFRGGFDIKATARGIVLQLLAIGATMLATLLLYLLLYLILSGFGVITLQSMITLVYSNPGLIIGFTIFALSMLTLFYHLLRSLFSVKAAATARGGAVLFAFISGILCFALPSLGFTTVIAALFAAAMLVVSACLGKQFENKFGTKMDTFMPYLVPFVVALPIMLPMTMVLAMVTPSIMLPVTMLPVIAMLMMVAPYMAALKPLLNSVMERLPKRTIRVQRIVTEKVEDPAKKGKFTEVTRKKTTNEKISWKYRQGVGMAALAVISAVIIMISGSAKMPIGASVYGNNGYQTMASSLFDDSLVVAWQGGGSNNSSLRIYDKAVYNDLRHKLDDYSWNSDKGAYTKDFSWTSDLKIPSIVGNSGKVEITPAANGLSVGYAEVEFKSASGIESINVLNADGGTSIEIGNPLRKSTIIVNIPLSDNMQTIRLGIDFHSGYVSNSVSVEYRQYSWYTSLSFMDNNSKDFGIIKSYLHEKDIASSVRFGMYFEYPLVVSI